MIPPTTDQLFNAIGQAIIALDLDGKVTFWNQVATDLYGWSSHEALGAQFDEMVKVVITPERITPRGAKLRNGRKVRIESFASGKNGIRLPVVMNEAPIYGETGQLIGYINSSTEVWVRDPLEDIFGSDERTKLIELQENLIKIKPLSGFIIPICASCKKIRDDKGFWNHLEEYLGEHFEAEFSHGVCPDCARELFPKLFPPEI